MSRVSKSAGRECAAFGCSNTFYNYDGTPSGLHFFKFPPKNQEKRFWCNAIKRIDGMDGFRVTDATCLCQGHFNEKDIKRNPNLWKLVAGAVPSGNLYYSVTPHPSRKEPRDRSTSQLSKEMQESTYSSTTSASSSTSASSLSLENAQASDLCTCPEDDYSLKNDSLYQDIVDLRGKVKSLEDENSQLREKLFSVDKLKSDDSAFRSYTSFPNLDTFMDIFSYLLPNLEHIAYW